MKGLHRGAEERRWFFFTQLTERVITALGRTPTTSLASSSSVSFRSFSCNRATGRRTTHSLRLTVSLLFSPFHSSNKTKKTTVVCIKLTKRRKFSRVEGRSYPPLYRAHTWAKGGWTHLRPSPFRDLSGPPE